MSITDELREYALGWDERNRVRCDLTAIADRIDAEHESALRETGEKIVGDVRKEWMPLPVDADGVPICVGDVMEWALVEDDGLTIVREVSAVGDGVFFAWSDEQHRYAQYESHVYRHHHAQTVEDVLREFANEVYADADNEIRDRDFLCAKYAKRLTLAESEEA